MAGSSVERLDQSGRIGGQGVHVLPIAGILGLSLAAMVIGDYPVLPIKSLPLGLEHGVVHEQTVRKHNGFPPTATFAIEKLDAVHLDRRQPGVPSERTLEKPNLTPRSSVKYRQQAIFGFPKGRFRRPHFAGRTMIEQPFAAAPHLIFSRGNFYTSTDDQVRELCRRVISAQGPEFEGAMSELQTALRERFEE